MNNLSASTLKAVKESATSGDILLPKVRAHVMAKAAIPDPERDQTVLHPSEMSKAKWCPRADYYRITDPQPEKINTNFRRENIYMEGHEIHRRWQLWLSEMGMLWGRWRCLKCGTTWTGLADQDSPCVECDADWDLVQYKEYFHRLGLIGGMTDGIVIWWDESGQMRVVLVEVKSLNIHTLRFEGPKMSALFYALQNQEIDLDQLWLSIKRPMPSHLKQAMLYLRMCLESGHDILSKVEGVLFIYECKWNQDAKEMFVKYRPSIVDGLVETARVVEVSVRRGRPVDRPEWADVDDEECKKCTYRNTCWEIQRVKDNSAPKVRKASSAKRRRGLG